MRVGRPVAAAAGRTQLAPMRERVDLLVAVTAAHHRLTVLHTDRDFETIAQLTEQPTARIN